MTTKVLEQSTGLDREDLHLILESIRDYGKEHLPDDKLLQLDHDDVCPIEIVRDMCGDGLGVQLLFIPEEYDGMGGGAFDVYRVCEELAHIDLGVATAVFATFLGSDPIVFGGTQEQQKHWMTRLANEGLLMAYVATEPQAGSDLGAMRTTAIPVEEDGKIVGYRINGGKQWISNGGYADLYTVLAVAPGGPSWFVVEKDTPGLAHGNPEDKHGIRLSNTATVSLEDVIVDTDHLIGGIEGQGLQQAQAVFGYTRLMVAAFGLGAGWAALDRAIPYSLERVQSGGPLAEKQGYTHKLIVPLVVRLEAGRAFIEETAERIDANEGILNTEGAIAKYLSTEAGNDAAEAGIQALGGYGYTREYMVEKIRRDVRITTIYEGTSEILEMTIARDRWQMHLKTRGKYYHDLAETLEAQHRNYSNVGFDIAALAYHALAEVMEWARVHLLTRNQHILFRLGELIAYAEGAASLARRAVRAFDGSINEKSDMRFQPEALAAMSRIFARQAALKISTNGMRIVGGVADLNDAEMSKLESALNVSEIYRTQRGWIDDMNYVADVLYGRQVE